MQVMVPYEYKLFVEGLTYLVESGKIPMARIDDAVERILRVKFVAGLFEFPFTDRSLLDTVGCKVTSAEFITRCIDIIGLF
jgi:beta-glucosidase